MWAPGIFLFMDLELASISSAMPFIHLALTTTLSGELDWLSETPIWHL